MNVLITFASQSSDVTNGSILTFVDTFTHSALIEKQINAKQYETYKEIIPKSESGLDNIMLFVNLSTQNYSSVAYLIIIKISFLF